MAVGNKGFAGHVGNPRDYRCSCWFVNCCLLIHKDLAQAVIKLTCSKDRLKQTDVISCE
jgi:hypothetical protein